MESYYKHNDANFELFEKLSAFNLYKSHGFETACSVYPEQRNFIIANMDKTLEEVRLEGYKSIDRLNNAHML